MANNLGLATSFWTRVLGPQDNWLASDYIRDIISCHLRKLRELMSNLILWSLLDIRILVTLYNVTTL